jgi:hypothetical protein
MTDAVRLATYSLLQPLTIKPATERSTVTISYEPRHSRVTVRPYTGIATTFLVHLRNDCTPCQSLKALDSC